MRGYTEESGTLCGQGNMQLYWHSWCSPNPRAILVLVHGLGEHCGRYGNLIKRLEDEGVSFFALDHRGHGRSLGARGHLDSFNDYVQDLHLLVEKVRLENPDLPIIMLGHSLGGLIAGHYALTYPQNLQGLILSAAAVIQKKPIPSGMQKVLRAVSKAAPRLAVSNGLDVKHLSQDKSVCKAYIDDPLVHDRITIKWGVEFMEHQKILLKRASELRMPLFIIHGTGDNIVDYRGSQQIFSAAGSPDKELHLFEGLYHETMNERLPERDQVLDTAAEWVKRHTNES